MRKYTKSPELCSGNSSSTLKSYRTTQANLKVPPSLSSKILSIKSRLGEILNRKEKARKALIKVQKKFKISLKKEKNLEILSSSIESRIKNLEKRESLLKLSKASKIHESNHNLILLLSNYLLRFRAIMQQERQLDEEEQELNQKEEFSFCTHSSESTQAGSVQRDLNPFEFLKTAANRAVDQKDSIVRSSSFNKYKRQALESKKETILAELLELHQEFEKFCVENEEKIEFNQKALRQNLEIDQRIVEINRKRREVWEIVKENERMKEEIQMIKNGNRGKVTKEDLKEVEKRVEEDEEKNLILRDSVEKGKVLVDSLRKRVKILDEDVKKKVDGIRKKEELNEILKKIEEEVGLRGIKEKEQQRKIRIRELVRLALAKEKEVRANENIRK